METVWRWGQNLTTMYNYRPFGVASSINKPLLLREEIGVAGALSKWWHNYRPFVDDVKGFLRKYDTPQDEFAI